MKQPEPTFKDFWDAYALKRDRIAAERAWNRLSQRDRRAALAGIAPYTAACAAQGISRMYAQGYLNHRRWEDDPTPPVATPPPSHAATPTTASVATQDALTAMETW